MECRPRNVSHGKQSSHPWRLGTEVELWRTGRESLAPHTASKSALEEPEDVQVRRETHQAPRHTGQDEWQSAVRLGCERPGNARGGRRAPACVWREAEEFQCGQSESDSRRAARD